MLICGFTNRNIKYIMDVTDEIALIGNTMLFYDLVAANHPLRSLNRRKFEQLY